MGYNSWGRKESDTTERQTHTHETGKVPRHLFEEDAFAAAALLGSTGSSLMLFTHWEQVSQEGALQPRLANTGHIPLTPHRGRITPTSHNIKSLEKGCAD